MSEPLHLHPTAPLAARVLLPGDPGRALRLAQALLEAPKMLNHNRGLWGYTGTAPDGQPLSIQSTGIGGPSAAIVVSELIDLGAQSLIRVGTCGALDGSLTLGELLLVAGAIAADGTSRALGAADAVAADAGLRERLQAVSGLRGVTVVTTDLFYEDREGLEQAWAAAGAVAVDMETATVLALAAKRGVPAATVLAVSDLLSLPIRARIDNAALVAAEHRMGELALRALAQSTPGLPQPAANSRPR